MMDAVTYITNMRRMCKSQGDTCRGCKLSNEDEEPCYLNKTAPEYCVTVVERWAAEHPVKTLQSVFLKMLPNVPLNDKGQPAFCPKLLDTAYHPVGSCCLDVDICQRCMDNFWGQEVEE